jgi:hexosaminidase
MPVQGTGWELLIFAKIGETGEDGRLVTIKMFMSYYRSVLFIRLLTASVFVVCSVEPRTLHAEAINLSHQSARPLTIPAIREWRSTAGWFLLNSNSRIVVSSSAPSELKDTAELFAGELKSISGLAVAEIVQQNPIPREGDILLAIDPENRTLGEEGYNISIGPYIAIRAPKSAGVFYGTRTVLQIIHQSASGKGIMLPKGDIRDRPQYQERGLMIDIARKYFTPQWLRRRVLDLAYLKMNYLHLHISDNEGFGIENHRGFCPPEGGVLKKIEVSDLIKMAQLYYITVVPEIDMPGHMGAILCNNRYARFRLQGLFGITNNSVLDITSKEAREFAKELIVKYSGLFPGKYWHMGADEVLFPWEAWLYPSFENYAKKKYGPTASTKDTINDFVNEIDTFVHRQHSNNMSHALRVWNDQVGDGVPKSAIAEDVTVDWWTDFSLLSESKLWDDPTNIVGAGHHIMNHGWWPTYYVTGGFIHPPNPDMRTAYESWSVEQFIGDFYLLSTAHSRPHTLPHGKKWLNLGAALNVWNDHPNFVNEVDVSNAIFEPLRVMAQKTWGSPALYSDFHSFQGAIRTVGEAPPQPLFGRFGTKRSARSFSQ